VTNELDVNQLVAAFLQANLDSLADAASAQVKAARTKIRSKLKRTYSTYLTRILDRYSKAKSFLIKREPTPLYDFFVPLDLSTDQRILTKPGVQEVAAVARTAIIAGTGGCGKSMLMRHMLVSAIQTGCKVPVFIELRQLNASGEPLRELLLQTLTANGLDVDDAYLELALSAGHFCILLDGFDELERARRRRASRDIRSLAEKYPQNWLIVSSRPDSFLQGWTGFALLDVSPLDLERAVELVERLPFSGGIKASFVSALQDELFERHESFLSNPLLLSIMLLTYSDVAHIPEKLSLFYNQAYESLFQQHDALKEGYQRERQSGLDIQDFEIVFSAFCLQSYDAMEFSFSPTKVLHYLDKGKPLCHVEYDSAAVLGDSLQAVCLLIQDGLDITFAHRSFQEYFVARYVQRSPPPTQKVLIERFARLHQFDSVMSLLHEMDSYAVEKFYILPAIEKLRKQMRVTKKVGVTHYLRYVKYYFESFNTVMNPDGKITAMIQNPETYLALLFAHDRYMGNAEALERRGMVPESRDALTKALVEESGGSKSIETKKFTTRSPFFRELVKREVYGWGMDFVETVLSVGDLIRKRHEETQRSLEELIG